MSRRDTGVIGRLSTELALGLVRLLVRLPYPWLCRIGEALGALLYHLAGSRRRVVLTNLRLCFPDMTDTEREALARRHVRLVVRSFLERGIIWFGSEAQIRRLIRLEGLHHVKPADGSKPPTLLLTPHFVGLDICGSRLGMEINAAGIYSPQTNPVIDRWLLYGRTRFGDQMMMPRDIATRPVVREVKGGRPLYYMPDLDHGVGDGMFIPFFGVPAATLTSLSRMARLTGAQVVPTLSRMLPDYQGYVLEMLPPWTDFPSDDVEADTRRMNAAIEQWILEQPEQYYWVHKRFKTRPPGEGSVY